MNPLQRAIVLPLGEIPVDRLPRRKIPRQHPPLAAALGEIQDRIEHLASRCRTRSPAWLGGGNERGNSLPLSVG